MSQSTITIPVQLRQIGDPGTRRYALSCVEYTPGSVGSGFLATTDGRKAAIVPCESSVAERVLIPRGVVPSTIPKGRALLSLSYRVYREGKRWFGERFKKGVAANEDVRVAYEPDGKFPSVASIVPTVGDDWHCLRINAALLHDLARALSPTCTVCLMFNDNASEGVAVVGMDGGNGIGVIMRIVGERGELQEARLFNDFAERFRKADAKVRVKV